MIMVSINFWRHTTVNKIKRKEKIEIKRKEKIEIKIKEREKYKEECYYQS